MRMKKIAALFMAAVLVFCLCACSDNKEEKTPDPTGTITETPTEAVTEAPTADVTETPTEAVTETPTEAVTEAPTEAPAPQEVHTRELYVSVQAHSGCTAM